MGLIKGKDATARSSSTQQALLSDAWTVMHVGKPLTEGVCPKAPAWGTTTQKARRARKLPVQRETRVADASR